MATHFSILAWEMPWPEEPGGLQHKESDMTEHGHKTRELQGEICAEILFVCLFVFPLMGKAE